MGQFVVFLFLFSPSFSAPLFSFFIKQNCFLQGAQACKDCRGGLEELGIDAVMNRSSCTQAGSKNRLNASKYTFYSFNKSWPGTTKEAKWQNWRKPGRQITQRSRNQDRGRVREKGEKITTEQGEWGTLLNRAVAILTIRAGPWGSRWGKHVRGKRIRGGRDEGGWCA